MDGAYDVADGDDDDACVEVTRDFVYATELQAAQPNDRLPAWFDMEHLEATRALVWRTRPFLPKNCAQWSAMTCRVVAEATGTSHGDRCFFLQLSAAQGRAEAWFRLAAEFMELGNKTDACTNFRRCLQALEDDPHLFADSTDSAFDFDRAASIIACVNSIAALEMDVGALRTLAETYPASKACAWWAVRVCESSTPPSAADIREAVHVFANRGYYPSLRAVFSAYDRMFSTQAAIMTGRVPASELVCHLSMCMPRCVLCNVSAAAVELEPCGHRVLCVCCLSRSRKCPVCSTVVGRWLVPGFMLPSTNT